MTQSQQSLILNFRKLLQKKNNQLVKMFSVKKYFGQLKSQKNYFMKIIQSIILPKRPADKIIKSEYLIQVFYNCDCTVTFFLLQEPYDRIQFYEQQFQLTVCHIQVQVRNYICTCTLLINYFIKKCNSLIYFKSLQIY